MTTSVGLRAEHTAAEMGGHYHAGQGPEKWKQHRLGEEKEAICQRTAERWTATLGLSGLNWVRLEMSKEQALKHHACP